MGESKKVVNELLVDLFHHILSIHEDALIQKGVKLSITEVHVLEKIKKVTIKTMGNIAKSLRITVGTLTTSVSGLVRKGYVIRKTDDKDRRKVFLELTNKADEVLKIHDEFHAEMLEKMFVDLKLEEDEALIKTLDKLTKYFYEMY